jgi:hypothetical protein
MTTSRTFSCSNYFMATVGRRITSACVLVCFLLRTSARMSNEELSAPQNCKIALVIKCRRAHLLRLTSVVVVACDGLTSRAYISEIFDRLSCLETATRYPFRWIVKSGLQEDHGRHSVTRGRPLLFISPLSLPYYGMLTLAHRTVQAAVRCININTTAVV